MVCVVASCVRERAKRAPRPSQRGTLTASSLPPAPPTQRPQRPPAERVCARQVSHRQQSSTDAGAGPGLRVPELSRSVQSHCSRVGQTEDTHRAPAFPPTQGWRPVAQIDGAVGGGRDDARASVQDVNAPGEPGKPSTRARGSAKLNEIPSHAYNHASHREVTHGERGRHPLLRGVHSAAPPAAGGHRRRQRLVQSWAPGHGARRALDGQLGRGHGDDGGRGGARLPRRVRCRLAGGPVPRLHDAPLRRPAEHEHRGRRAQPAPGRALARRGRQPSRRHDRAGHGLRAGPWDRRQRAAHGSRAPAGQGRQPTGDALRRRRRGRAGRGRPADRDARRRVQRDGRLRAAVPRAGSRPRLRLGGALGARRGLHEDRPARRQRPAQASRHGPGVGERVHPAVHAGAGRSGRREADRDSRGRRARQPRRGVRRYRRRSPAPDAGPRDRGGQTGRSHRRRCVRQRLGRAPLPRGRRDHVAARSAWREGLARAAQGRGGLPEVPGVQQPHHARARHAGGSRQGHAAQRAVPEPSDDHGAHRRPVPQLRDCPVSEGPLLREPEMPGARQPGRRALCRASRPP